MSKSCCEDKQSELIKLRERQGKVLKIVFAINLSMFLLELSAGLIAKSSSLLADSLDMFGDATVYAFSLFVLHKSARWRAGAALSKGFIMVAFGLGVLTEASIKAFTDVLPVAETMGSIGLLALLANGSCLYLLFNHKEDDINMRSTWICSRNDIIANVGVLLAAGAVGLTHSKWPDIAVGLVIALLFLKSAASILKDAIVQFRTGVDA